MALLHLCLFIEPFIENTSDPVKVETVDYQVATNTVEHHTDEYEITQIGQERPPQLVVRRGQPYEVQLKLDREFNKGTDKIKIIMEIGI